MISDPTTLDCLRSIQMLADKVAQHEDYIKFLENEGERVDKLITKLVIEHMRATLAGEPLNPTIMELKGYLGSDWYIDLPEDDRKVVGAYEGWYEPEWEGEEE